MSSLSRHLAISLAISLTVIFLVQAVLVGVVMYRLTEDVVISRLEDDMEGILIALSVQDGTDTIIDWELIPEIFKRPFSGHYFQIYMAGQTIRARSLWDEALQQYQPGVYNDIDGPMDQKLLVFSRKFTVHNQPVLLIVAEDISRLDTMSWYFQKWLFSLSLIALILLLVIQIWVVRRGLKPLTGLKNELQRLERGETDKLKQAVPAEIAPLINEVNRLLTVLQLRLQRSRNAIGNLSHALKTPLTLISQILKRKYGDEDRMQLFEQIQKIEQHVNRELSQARMAGQSPCGLWFEPQRDILDLVSTLDSVYQERVHIDLQMPEISFINADREDMMELIGNVLDNACKWAKGRIILQIYEESGLVITVEDDGPGMQPEAQSTVLERGVRLDEAKQGHGLGLAIVRDIVKVYEGTLTMGCSETLGGVRVSIFLPKLPTLGSDQPDTLN